MSLPILISENSWSWVSGRPLTRFTIMLAERALTRATPGVAIS
jgi:hypothetical protein